MLGDVITSKWVVMLFMNIVGIPIALRFETSATVAALTNSGVNLPNGCVWSIRNGDWSELPWIGTGCGLMGMAYINWLVEDTGVMYCWWGLGNGEDIMT